VELKIKSLLISLLFLLCTSALFAEDIYNWKILYERALQQSPSLAEKEKAISAAAYKWKSSRRGRGPSLYFESDLSYMTSPREVDLSQGSLYPGGTLAPGLDFPPLPETDVSLPLSGNQWYSFRLVLEQPLITSGKLAAQEKIYRSLWENSGMDRDQRQLSVKAQIMSTIHTLDSLKEILDLAGEQKIVAERFVTLTENAYNTGMTSYSDFMTAQVKAREITLMEKQIRKQQNQALLQLEYLCRLENLRPDQISSEGLPAISPSGNREDLLSSTIEHSPLLKMLRRGINIAKENKKLTQGNSYGRPDLGLKLQLDYAGETLPFTSDEWGFANNNLTASVGVRALLGDFGKSWADVKESESRISEAEERYKDKLEQMRQSIGEEIFNQNLSMETIDYYNSKAEDDRSVAQQKKESWKAGYGLEQDYLLQMIMWYSDLIYAKQEEMSLTLSCYKLMVITGFIPG